MVKEVKALKAEKSKRRHQPLKRTTGIIHRNNMDIETQKDVERLIKTQKWTSFVEVDYGKDSFGRGLLSLHHLEKDDIIVDYHGNNVII